MKLLILVVLFAGACVALPSEKCSSCTACKDVQPKSQELRECIEDATKLLELLKKVILLVAKKGECLSKETLVELFNHIYCILKIVVKLLGIYCQEALQLIKNLLCCLIYKPELIPNLPEIASNTLENLKSVNIQCVIDALKNLLAKGCGPSGTVSTVLGTVEKYIPGLCEMIVNLIRPLIKPFICAITAIACKLTKLSDCSCQCKIECSNCYHP